jgi:hypothetical protein
MDALAKGTILGTADFVARRTGDTAADFYRVRLNGVVVSSYRLTTALDGRPVEEFTLSFDHVPPPPTVTQVYVGSSAWTPSFRGYLQARGLGSDAFGFAIGGGAEQLLSLPWAGLDRVSIRFSAPVVVAEADLAVRGVTVPSYRFTSFAYDPATRTATWTLDRPVSADKLLLDLASGAQSGVRGTSGQPLDGEWADGQPAYPSGDGAAGGHFRMRLNALRGDVTRNGRADALDLRQVLARRSTGLTNPGAPPNTYSVFHDVTGDGQVNALDAAATRLGMLRSLPPGDPGVSVVQSASGAAPLAFTSVARDLFSGTPLLE